MKVVFLTDGVFPHKVGGIQRHTFHLVTTLSSQHDSLDITVLHPHESKIFQNSEIKEKQILPINTDKNYLIEKLKYGLRLKKEIDELDFDILFIQGLNYPFGWNKTKSKIIFHPHGLEPFQTSSIYEKVVFMPFRLLTIYIMRKSDITISLGGKLTGLLRKYTNENQLRIVPNATNFAIAPFHKIIDEDIIKCCFISRFAVNKGIDILIDSIIELKSRGKLKYFKFILGGKGPLFKKYENLIDREGISENVDLKGFVSDLDLKNLYKEADLFVFPTRYEGMPTVILEAMAYECAIISTDVGAISEIVSYENGYLIQPNNRVELVNSLMDVLKNRASLKSKQKNSRRQIEAQYRWEHVSNETFNLFKEVINV